ncbi:hypothetical protein GWN26_12375 [Candidatus Saccharibacteria bacterium]|nr:hypothetical protein [Candidatus Saccharibacteria bacterium]NIW80226.1 hypothetical protein [Calditrichia bacterium]
MKMKTTRQKTDEIRYEPFTEEQLKIEVFIKLGILRPEDLPRLQQELDKNRFEVV